MKNIGVIGKFVKYLIVVLFLMIPSLLLIPRVFADNNGGYPWADAETVDQYTYDWGYPQCQQAMIDAGRCDTHVQYKWGIKYMLSDPWGYDLRNCTSYVAWRVNNDYGIAIPGWGNANNWDNSADGKYPVDNNPAVGDIAVWEGLFGHVAFVTNVNTDGSFEVDQYNNAGAGEFSHQLRGNASHFIHIKPVVNTQPVTAINQGVVTPPNIPSNPEPPKLPDPTPLDNTLVPKPLVNSGIDNQFPDTNEIKYLLEYSPNSEEINVFAVKYANTKSGNIEINQSKIDDGNTRFKETISSSMKTQNIGTNNFELADFNNDKYLDLYIINRNDRVNNNTNITILDGKSNYQTQILNTQTTLITDPLDKITYKIANSDNSNKPDIYKISKSSKEDKTKFEILDGINNYKNSSAMWTTDGNTLPNNNVNYIIGDDDRDGKSDIYVVNQDINDNNVMNVNIYNQTNDYKNVTRKIILNNSDQIGDEKTKL